MKTKMKTLWIVGISLTGLIWSCNEAGKHEYPAYVEQQLTETSEEADDIVTEGEEGEFNTESYDRIYENQFYAAIDEPLSTFSIDVDNASYTNIRRFLNYGQTPPKDAVRIEEMVNYFDYDYAQPKGKHPFSFETEVATCPWNKDHQLVHIGIQGQSMNYEDLKPSNLVFLIDASGSMSSRQKLPLLKQSLKLLLNELSEQDRVAIVAYAGSAGLVLPSTPATEKDKIIEALDDIDAGGSTAGGQGIQLAYDVAKKNLIKDGNNRVILATDGDFNVGVSSQGELVRLIEEKRKDNIYLTICGFGMGNYKDGTMEQISNAGNGNYFYIDNEQEARKVFVTEMRANMFTIAKDVKIQVEFNPNFVDSYRLIGFENRILEHQDFDNDLKDAGELGAGHTVTALYEIVPAKGAAESRQKLKYQTRTVKDETNSELMTLKFRYKPIDSNHSHLISTFINTSDTPFENTSDNFKWSAAVAGFGLLLRDSQYKGEVSYKHVKDWAKEAIGEDENGYRNEFLNLVDQASKLSDK